MGEEHGKFDAAHQAGPGAVAQLAQPQWVLAARAEDLSQGDGNRPSYAAFDTMLRIAALKRSSARAMPRGGRTFGRCTASTVIGRAATDASQCHRPTGPLGASRFQHTTRQRKAGDLGGHPCDNMSVVSRRAASSAPQPDIEIIAAIVLARDFRGAKD